MRCRSKTLYQFFSIPKGIENFVPKFNGAGCDAHARMYEGGRRAANPHTRAARAILVFHIGLFTLKVKYQNRYGKD